MHELPWTDVRLTEELDKRARLVIHRLVAVSQLYLQRSQRTEQEPMARIPSRLNQMLVDLGHDPVPRGQWTMCVNFGAAWKKQHRQNLIATGKCPNDFIWQIPRNLHHPWVYPQGAGLFFHGKNIHPSHSIVYYRGAIYCNHCGYYTAGSRCAKLSIPCLLKKVPSQMNVLKGMRRGVFPNRAKGWPLPDEAQAPTGIMPYTINGVVAEDLPCFGR